MATQAYVLISATPGKVTIPIALRGTREIWPADERLLRPGPITISIGSPIRPQDGGWKEIVRLRDAARAEIARRL